VVVRPRYQMLDKARECSVFDDDEACSTSGSSHEQEASRGSLDELHHSVLALERLYLTPLDWSRGLPLAMMPGDASQAAPMVLAAQQQQQQQQQTPPDQREKTPDYYANVGDAIRTLREDIPLLFEKELNCEC